jgi:hypothetical protein
VFADSGRGPADRLRLAEQLKRLSPVMINAVITGDTAYLERPL